MDPASLSPPPRRSASGLLPILVNIRRNGRWPPLFVLSGNLASMHARELVELAALLAMHGQALVRSREPIPQSSLEEYWIASKTRLERWARTLKSLNDGGEAAVGTRPLVRAVLEEILSSEVLTRVWTAVATASDRRHGTDSTEPIARSVLVAHLEARHRVLTLMVRSSGIDAEYAVKLNSVRRRSERWTDMLIGQLLEVGDVSELAAEPARAREFARGLREQAQEPGGRIARSLALASLRAAFGRGLEPHTPNADLNARIGGSILACFGPELFDSSGALRSTWLLRLTAFADDTQGTIEELLQADSRGMRGDSPGTACRRLADRLRRFRQ